jgi:hypothetical protein
MAQPMDTQQGIEKFEAERAPDLTGNADLNVGGVRTGRRLDQDDRQSSACEDERPGLGISRDGERTRPMKSNPRVEPRRHTGWGRTQREQGQSQSAPHESDERVSDGVQRRRTQETDGPPGPVQYLA